jgi:hypothetical protein
MLSTLAALELLPLTAELLVSRSHAQTAAGVYCCSALQATVLCCDARRFCNALHCKSSYTAAATMAHTAAAADATFGTLQAAVASFQAAAVTSASLMHS